MHFLLFLNYLVKTTVLEPKQELEMRMQNF